MHEPSVRVVRHSELSDATPQTSGLLRQVAFDSRNPDATVLSAFLSTVLPGAATGAHHHGDQETILYVLEGTARYRWATACSTSSKRAREISCSSPRARC